MKNKQKISKIPKNFKNTKVMNMGGFLVWKVFFFCFLGRLSWNGDVWTVTGTHTFYVKFYKYLAVCKKLSYNRYKY